MATDIFRRLVIGCAWACLFGLAGSAGVGCACLLSAGWILCLGCYVLWDFMVRADIFLNLELQEYMQFVAIAANSTIFIIASGSGWVWLGAAVDLYGALSLYV